MFHCHVRRTEALGPHCACFTHMTTMEKRQPLGMQWLASAGCLVIYCGDTKCVEILIEEKSEVIKVSCCLLVTSTLCAFLLRK